MRIKMSRASGEMGEEMYALFKVNYARPLIFLCSQTACNTVALPRRDCNSALRRCRRRRRLFENCNENSKRKYYLARKMSSGSLSLFSHSAAIREYRTLAARLETNFFVASSFKKNISTVLRIFAPCQREYRSTGYRCSFDSRVVVACNSLMSRKDHRRV